MAKEKTRYLRHINDEGQWDYFAPTSALELRVGDDMHEWEGDLKKAPKEVDPALLVGHPSQHVANPGSPLKRNWVNHDNDGAEKTAQDLAHADLTVEQAEQAVANAEKNLADAKARQKTAGKSAEKAAATRKANAKKAEQTKAKAKEKAEKEG